MGLWPTQADENQLPLSNYSPWKHRPPPLSSRPERTRISYFALLATSTCAALRRESRMQILNATGLHRKSGRAQWRDLRFFSGPQNLLKPGPFNNLAANCNSQPLWILLDWRPIP
jgi:hypothetical protein